MQVIEGVLPRTFQNLLKPRPDEKGETCSQQTWKWKLDDQKRKGMSGRWEATPLPTLPNKADSISARMTMTLSSKREGWHYLCPCLKGCTRTSPITVPEQADMTDNLNYCPYHRRLGHTLEICYTLKSWIRNKINQGTLSLLQISTRILHEQRTQHL